MIDTLYVATNALQDTLRIILSSTDKHSFLSQYSPLIIAFCVVIISSSIQLYITNRRLKFEREKENEYFIVDAIQKQISRYIKVIKKISYDISEQQQPICSRKLDSLFFEHCQIKNVLENDEENDENDSKLKDLIDNVYEELKKTNDYNEQIDLMKKHVKQIIRISHKVKRKILGENKCIKYSKKSTDT